MSSYNIVLEGYEKTKQGTFTLREFFFALWSKAVHLSAEERSKAEQLIDTLNDGDPLTLAHIVASRGFLTVYNANFAKGIDFFEDALQRYHKLDEQDGVLTCNTLLCVCYRSMGQLDKAHAYLQPAIRSSKEITIRKPHTFFVSIAYYQAGELNAVFKNYEEAIQYYNEGLKYTKENPELNARLHSGLGVVYMNTGDWERSINSLNEALADIDQAKNHLLSSKIYNDIANYHSKRQEYDEALASQHKSLKIRLEHKLINPITTSYVSLADIYFKMGNFKEAIHYGELAVEQATKLNTIIKLFEAHETLSKAYESIGDISKAFENYKNFHKYRAEVHNQETMKTIEQLTSRHKMEQVEIEKDIFRLRNVELKEAFDEIELKQKEILDSIRYAKRIQNALMISEGQFERCLKRLM